MHWVFGTEKLFLFGDNKMTIHKKNLDNAPAIIIDQKHYEPLINLANSYIEKSPYVAERLLEEIDRADVRTTKDLPAGVVQMHSQVTYIDEVSQKKETVFLVWPDEADIEQKKVSIMTPIGAALIGLSEEDRLEWVTNSGQVKNLKILKVHHNTDI